MAQYTRGKVSVTAGTDVVTGADTRWYNQIKVGDLFKTRDTPLSYTVAAVVSDTEIRLERAWQGETVASAEYQIIRDFTLNHGFQEIYPGDKDWSFSMTQNLRRIDKLLNTIPVVETEPVLTVNNQAVLFSTEAGELFIKWRDRNGVSRSHAIS